MDRLAAQRERLAGQDRTDPVGVRRDRAQTGAGRDRADPGEFGRARAPGAARDRKSTTSELQSPCNLVCRLLLEKKNKMKADRERRRTPYSAARVRGTPTY